MKNARELLEGVFKESWRDAKVMVGMFTEDGALELPYLDRKSTRLNSSH